jgi:uncharacterized membrane protein
MPLLATTHLTLTPLLTCHSLQLIKNPRYNFWNHDFTRCAPDIERLFKSVANSCMGPQQQGAAGQPGGGGAGGAGAAAGGAGKAEEAGGADAGGGK